MTRKEILDIINEIIEEEHGNRVTERSILMECGIDSFGYAMLFVGLEAKILEVTGIKVFDPKVLSEINPSTLLVSALLDDIEAKLCI